MIFLLDSFSPRIRPEQVVRFRRAHQRLHLAMKRREEKAETEEDDAKNGKAKILSRDESNTEVQGYRSVPLSCSTKKPASNELQEKVSWKEQIESSTEKENKLQLEKEIEGKKHSNSIVPQTLLQSKETAKEEKGKIQSNELEKGEMKKSSMEKKDSLEKGDIPLPQKKSIQQNVIAKPFVEEEEHTNRKNAQAERYEEPELDVGRMERGTSERKLSKLKMKIQISGLSKRQAKVNRRREREREKERNRKPESSERRTREEKILKEKGQRKTLGEKLRDQFHAVKSLFAGSKAGKAQKTAEAKLSKKNLLLGKVADGDDALPQLGVKEHTGYDDCWIEDPAVLTNRSHRPDLMLVNNNENSGQLWHESKRPFWRNKMLQKEIPPILAEKTISKILLDVINKKIPIADPAPDPTPYFRDYLMLDEMTMKDEIWFKEQQILSNTIRSIIGAINDEFEEQEDEEKEKQEKTKVDNKLRVTFKEPTTVISYYRHDNTKRETLPFVKSAPGKPKRIKRCSTTSSSPSSSSISSSAVFGSISSFLISSTNASSSNEKVSSADAAPSKKLCSWREPKLKAPRSNPSSREKPKGKIPTKNMPSKM